MPDPASDADAMQRYQAIEQAYCDSRWREVLREGERLLDGVRRGDVEDAEGLEDRLQLLLGHTYLYGFGDRDAAEDHYSAVLASRADTTLRQIAQEGLDQCNLPRASAGDSIEDIEAELTGPEPPDRELPSLDTTLALARETAAPEPSALPAMPWQSDDLAAEEPAAATEPPFGSVDASAAATPWLNTGQAPEPAPAQTPAPEPVSLAKDPLPRLLPEVLEEPEQIEVHQAMPELADEHVLEPIEWLEPIQPGELSWSPSDASAAGATAPAEPPVAEEPEVAPLVGSLGEALEEPLEPPLDGPMDELPELAPIVPTSAAPPEEDPELMRGLLRVEIR